MSRPPPMRGLPVKLALMATLVVTLYLLNSLWTDSPTSSEVQITDESEKKEVPPNDWGDDRYFMEFAIDEEDYKIINPDNRQVLTPKEKLLHKLTSSLSEEIVNDKGSTTIPVPRSFKPGQ